MLTLLLLFLSAPSRADIELPRAKEKIVSWLVTPDDKRIAKESAAHRKSLKECGYDVVEVNGGSPTSLTARMKSESIPEGGLLLVDSHGLAYANGEFVFTKTGAQTNFRGGTSKPAQTATFEEEAPAKEKATFEDITLFKGEEFATALSTANQKPRLWLDVCHAGFCPIPAGCKAGTVCTYGSSSSDTVDVTQMLVDLMCSRKTDCSVWRQFDKNGDGLIKPEEFDAELKSRSNQASDTTLMKSIVPSPSQARDDFEKQCQTLGGSAQATAMGVPFEIQYHNLDENGFSLTHKMPLQFAYKPDPPRKNKFSGGSASVTAILVPDEPVLRGEYSEGYFAKDTAEANRIAKSRGFDPLDVKQLSEKSYVKLVCVKSLAVFTNEQYKQSPNLTQFDLEALNCATADGNSTDPSTSGKTHVKP